MVAFVRISKPLPVLNTVSKTDGISSARLESKHTEVISATTTAESPVISQLQTFVEHPTGLDHPFGRQCGEDLGRSLDAFRELKSTSISRNMLLYKQACLDAQMKQARTDVNDNFRLLLANFECCHATGTTMQWLKQGDLWPCMTPVTLL